MIAFIVFVFHVLLNYLLGSGVFSFFSLKKHQILNVFLAILLGVFIETMLVFIALWMGGTISMGLIFTIILTIALNYKHILEGKTGNLEFNLNKIKPNKPFKWFEWGLILLISEKIVVIIWQLLRLPTYFSDALKHWSTLAKAIYTGDNFTMDPSRTDFIAYHQLQTVIDYPLQLPIYRAIQATLNFEWNEFVSRSDGLLFFIIICGITGSIVHQLIGKRWVTLGAVYIVASLPLQVWHAAAGYADIAVEAYLVAVIACFIRKEWWLSGVFMAGAIWSKNEGFAMYLPGILLAIGTYHLFSKGVAWGSRMKKMGQFAVGVAMVLPWLIFQSMYADSVLNKIIEPAKKLLGSRNDYYDPNDFQVILTQVGQQFADSPPSYQLFWEKVFLGSTHGIFWLAIFTGLILMAYKMLKEAMGRSLLLFFISTCGIIYYIFTYTRSYEYLLLETTIHRVLLQFSAAALLIAVYGMSLYKEKEKKKTVKVKKKGKKKLEMAK